MVSPNVALACASFGAVVVAVSFFIGIAFMTSDEFATAGLGCNPDVLTNADAKAAAEAFCVDNAVVDEDGNVCQIANLGLYSAAYTPECTQTGGNPYALSSLLQPEDGAPADITVLFPSQTQLGSLPAALQITTVPAFSNCDEFLGGTSGFGGSNIASQVGTAAGFGNLEIILGSFLAATKETYDAAIVDLVDLTNSTIFVGTPATFTATAIGIASTVTASVVSSDITTTIGLGGANYTTDLRIAAGLATFGGKIADAAVAMIEAGLLVLPSETDAFVLATVGYDLLDNGIPDLGLWGPLQSDILCNIVAETNPCTGIEYLDALAAELFAFGAAGGDLASLVLTAKGATDLYLANAQVGFPFLTDDATVSGLIPSNPTVTAVFSTAGVVLNTQLAFNASLAELGSTSGFPNSPLTPMENENSVMSLLCGGLDLASSCSTLDFLAGTVASFYASGDNDTAADAEVVQLLVGTCAGNGQTISDCFGQLNLQNPAYISPTYRSIVLFTVFGSLYSLEDELVTQGEDAIIAAMVASCKESEENLAAIGLVQILAPTGTALIGLGLVISIINLLMRNDKVKVIGIIGGVLSLIGVILVLVGLITLQGAPIYASLGAEPEDPLPDNNTTFSLGSAYLLVLVFLGGAIVGSIVSIIGGALLSPKESSTDILGKA